jgi:hypothetical protein
MIGQTVFIKTVTYHYVARLLDEDAHFHYIDHIRQIRDTSDPGEFAEDAETGGTMSTYPTDVVARIPRGCVTFMATRSSWAHV